MAKIRKLSNNKLRRLNALADEAMALADSGEFLAANRICSKADREHKNFPYVLYARGLIAAKQDEHNNAAEWFGKAYKADPKPIEFQINYAASLFKAHLLEDAADMYQKICAKSPRLFEAHFSYGVVLADTGEFRLALQAYKEALSIKPSNLELIETIADLYNQLGELQKAIPLLSKTYKSAATNSQLQYKLGTYLLQQGRVVSSREYFRQALAINPLHIPALCLLINNPNNQHEYESDLSTLRNFYKELNHDSVAWQLTAFELGGAANKAGQYEEAFVYWTEGNRHKRKQIVFHEELEEKLYQTAMDAYPASRFNEQRPAPNYAPIFIVGMPRSGSTLLEHSLARHPALHAAGESNALRQSIFGRHNKGQYHRIFDLLTDLRDEELLSIMQDYERRQAEEYGAQGRIVDKTPDNYIYAGLIAKTLPQARIIHIKREPMASCLSMYQQNFANDGIGYSYDLDELGRQYARYQRIMQHWREALPEGVLLEVSYEDLVSNPEGELKRLLEGCNLEWHEDCLNAHKSTAKVTTASMSQVRQPIHKKSVDRWKHYEKQLAPLKQYLLE